MVEEDLSSIDLTDSFAAGKTTAQPVVLCGYAVFLLLSLNFGQASFSLGDLLGGSRFNYKIGRGGEKENCSRRGTRERERERPFQITQRVREF